MNDNSKQFRLIAPDVDHLLHCFHDGHMNPHAPTPALTAAMAPLFDTLRELAPLDSNDEAKTIWLQIPRGTIADYDSYEDMLECGEVESREEYETRWREDYPGEVKWYELVLIESFDQCGSLRFRAVACDDRTIISSSWDRNMETYHPFLEEPAVLLCSLLNDAAAVSMEKLRNGTYNDEVRANLPYWFRTGVIRRTALWEKDPEYSKQNALDGLTPETVEEFKRLLCSGVNDVQKIGRIKAFTANDFFRACALGYKALGYDCEDRSPSELHRKYADGRDEGLTGACYGLNEGPGIDFDNPVAWNQWYFGARSGGHPWEIVRGGNSTHVDLVVRHDERDLEWMLPAGKISQEEYERRKANAGFYFLISGKHRPLESVTFYTTLSAAGLPVILNDAEEIMARFDGSDYVGIVPRHDSTKYCESTFPARYGRVIDAFHVFDEDMNAFGNEIEWIPETDARLVSDVK